MFDHPLRYHVTSGTRPHVTHLCELQLYRGNGRCSCEHFELKLEGILAKGITPAEALRQKLVTLKRRAKNGVGTLPDKDPRDALRCEHLIEARRQHADDMIAAISKNETTHRAATPRSISKAELAAEARREVREEVREYRASHA